MRERILVIDDDEAIRKTVAESLEAEGYEVVEAERWTEMAPFAGRGWGHPDLVVLDLELPGRDGVEIARTFGQSEDRPAVVYFSGRLDLATYAVRTGGHPFVPKGAGVEALVRTVRRRLDALRATEAAA